MHCVLGIWLLLAVKFVPVTDNSQGAPNPLTCSSADILKQLIKALQQYNFIEPQGKFSLGILT